MITPSPAFPPRPLLTPPFSPPLLTPITSIYDLAGQDQKKIKHVQDTWRPIQQRFFEQAETAAAQVEAMELDAAQAMLKALMVNISTTLHDTLVGLNSSLPAM